MRYKLVIAYEGTKYHGWQIQLNGTSIQDLIEKALDTILQEKVKLTGAGRTDAGVHALGQVAHFDTTKPITPTRMWGSLNGLLPRDIRVLSVDPVPDDFHAQYSALSKTYRYHICTERVLSPFLLNRVWHITYPLDRQLLLEATTYAIGTHDFTSFANEAHTGVAAYDSERTIQRIDLIPEDRGIALEFQADGFLYKMVRNLVGTFVECGSHKKKPSDIPAILKAKDRRQAGLAAPAQGLFLVAVHYSEIT